MKISLAKKTKKETSIVHLLSKSSIPDFKDFNEEQFKYIKSSIKEEKEIILVNQFSHLDIIVVIDDEIVDHKLKEKMRGFGNQVAGILNKEKQTGIQVAGDVSGELTLYFVEGMMLGNYTFLKYFKDKKKKENTFNSIEVVSNKIKTKHLDTLKAIVDGTCFARNLVNEPLSYLTAQQMGKEAKKMGKKAGFSVEVLSKNKIETLKMGGVLAVNKGSVDPPAFIIMEWKPAKPKNKKPIVLVGKGIVYDTGGMSLKPTANSMDFMKSDMGGGAAVIGTMTSVAMAKLNVHVVGLVPATDNRPGGNAYVPGDVITMHDGSTVEVLNTDAEGRLVLADALTYAKKYKPELVIDLATLTGAAAYAVGPHAVAAMGNTDEEMEKLKESGLETNERIAEFPFFPEYAEMLKSTIADIKNIGGPSAGAITAGKFLEHFVDFPWMHIDIAGSAFLKTPISYRSQGGTGHGVRLLFDFISKR